MTLTPSQTIGPFFHGGTQWMMRADPPPEGWIAVQGTILDADDKPVNDALLEFNLDGNQGWRFQRVASDDDGHFTFHLPAGGFAHVTIFARGLLRHLFTRVYHRSEDVPKLVPADRRDTLVTRVTREGLDWTVHLSGEAETVFFELG